MFLNFVLNIDYIMNGSCPFVVFSKFIYLCIFVCTVFGVGV
jgi:hypothetical protein